MQDPSRVSIAVNDKGYITGYAIDNGSGVKVPFQPDEILHIKTPNPTNPYRGKGAIEAAGLYIQTEDYVARFSRNFIFNNGTPPGILNINGTMTPEEFERVKAKFNKDFGALDKAGKIAIVKNSEISFEKIGSTIQEADLAGLKNNVLDSIMAIFRVSKPMIGIVDDVNLANGKNAKRIFLENVIEPKMIRIVDAINTFVMPRYSSSTVEYRVNYDNPVPEDAQELATVLAALTDVVMTVNDGRAKLGLEPIDGGDTLRRPINLIDVGDPIESQKSLPESAPVVKITKTVKKKSLKRDLKYTKDQKEAYRKGMFSNQRKWEKKYSKAVGEAVDSLKRQVLAKVKSVDKAFDDLLPSENAIADLFAEKTNPIAFSLLKEQGGIAMNFVGSSEKFEVSASVKSYVSDRVDLFAGNLSSNLREKLANGIADIASSGGTINDTKKFIEDTFGSLKGYQAERIARTETSKYANAASVEAYKQTGYVEAKEWLANPGACEFCQEMDGKIISLDDSFGDLGGSVSGVEGGAMALDFDSVEEPPLHPNCECAILPSQYPASDARQAQFADWASDHDIAEFIGDDEMSKELASKATNIFGQMPDEMFSNIQSIQILSGNDPRWEAADLLPNAVAVTRQTPDGAVIMYNADAILKSRDKLGNVYLLSNTPRQVIAHEVGHSYYTATAASKELINTFDAYANNKLSTYLKDQVAAGHYTMYNSLSYARMAANDPKLTGAYIREYFADSFGLYMTNPSALQVTEPKVYELLRGYFAR